MAILYKLLQPVGILVLDDLFSLCLNSPQLLKVYKMKTRITAVFFAVSALSITGCASTNDYKAYSDGQAQIEVAKHKAEEAKWKALSDIAVSGDTTAKVAAVMALNAGSNGQQQSGKLQAPQVSEALQWASILLPSVTQMYSVAKTAAVAIRQSDNGARVAESTNNAFVGVAGKIQAPMANVTTNTTSTVATTSTNLTDAYNNKSTAVGDYSGSNSGNSGRLAGTSLTDSTHTPTIVTQPAAVIVTQPTPVIVTQPMPVIITQPAPVIVNPVIVNPVIVPPVKP